jgi:hypothetical protein
VTRREIEEFIRAAMAAGISGPFAMVGSKDVVRAIADRWQDDVAANRTSAYTDGIGHGQEMYT